MRDSDNTDMEQDRRDPLKRVMIIQQLKFTTYLHLRMAGDNDSFTSDGMYLLLSGRFLTPGAGCFRCLKAPLHGQTRSNNFYLRPSQCGLHNQQQL